MTKLTYPVLSPLRHDGKLYSPDDAKANAVALSEEEAEGLRAIGVLGDPTKIEAPADEAGRVAVILDHVAGFAVGDFTKDGKLRAAAHRALAGKLGWEPSPDDIATALKAFVSSQANSEAGE
ncbi:hypothetical protein [Phreatobacter stygius]|uniref:Uncharacterized protein n=1 Tax=Phreatobacter stygius TaxID=1940610 RepID=A0A4D7AV67_9HYPH|nr:hypothetical protein [Phreatobacter stygius]QCI65634.1 hypothetical protein E8M01_16320 [Phreatobacter stygius]